jgi:hypothetical protein
MCIDKHYSYRIEIQRAADGLRFPGGPVASAFLRAAREEAVFRARRRGFIDADQGDIHESPILMPEDGRSQISGINISVANTAHRSELEFGLELFAPAASMEAQQLVKQGHLKPDDKYLYRVFAKPAEPTPDSAGMAGVVSCVRRNAWPLLEGRLSDLQGRAEAVGPCESDDYPLFVTHRALEMARQYCRKPVDKEAGALLLGHLCRQRDPEPEIFGVIDDAIEARHADQTQFRLELTTGGFAYLQAQLRLRKTRMSRTHELPLGFAHAHNFLPAVLDDGQGQCPHCPKQSTCQLTSSFYSSEDVRFHQALFATAPYAVGLVWGYTPRAEDDLRVFCLNGGQARQRGYYLLQDRSQ